MVYSMFLCFAARKCRFPYIVTAYVPGEQKLERCPGPFAVCGIQ